MTFSSRLLRLLAAAALAWVALPAAAADWQIQAGRSYMDGHGANTVFIDATWAPHSLGIGSLTWAPDATAGWIAGRDLAAFHHARYGTSDDIWLAAAGARFQMGAADDWYRNLYFSFQIALHTGRTQALSSPYEFVSTLGWQWHRFSFGIRHISNAKLHQPNRGETMALVGWSFGGVM